VPGSGSSSAWQKGRRGVQALQVRILEPPPTVAKTGRKNPDEMIVIVEDLIKLLDGLSASYRRGRHPDGRDARRSPPCCGRWPTTSRPDRPRPSSPARP
jgi:CspA family cold shock protein